MSGLSYALATALERTLDFDDLECLDDISILDIVVSCNGHTALLSCADLLDAVLADLQGAKLAGINHDAVAYEAHLGLLHHLAVAYETSCDGADLADAEGLLNIGGSDDLFLLLRLEHTLDTILDFVDTVVDD